MSKYLIRADEELSKIKGNKEAQELLEEIRAFSQDEE